MPLKRVGLGPNDENAGQVGDFPNRPLPPIGGAPVPPTPGIGPTLPDQPPPPPGTEGNREGPRDQPGASNLPIGPLNINIGRPPMGGTATPGRPVTPTPVASQPPQPFTPITPSMSDSDAALPQALQRRPLTGGAVSGSSLLGGVGGLLGGGLGVPGLQGGSDLPSMLVNLFRMINRGSGA